MASNLSDVESIFYAAIDLPTPEECRAHVQSACAGDEALRQRVEGLLQAHFRAGNFLEPPATAAQLANNQAIQEGPGAVVGSYKLLQQIGEGGMGVVFLAEQSRPVQRTVALKIIKPGMDTRQVIARFTAEQQALALMDHPNIARVFDAGTTDSGRPYFVMELVKGVPITDYCDQRRLTLHQRLELFIPICHAVQHAHQKGIIHRDLKPTNVLVALYDGQPVPKVIDFGVAKAIEPKLTERTKFTEIGQVVGTLEYMSPEQAELNQLDVDTRSDVYSLGVLLYELLTGTTPFERKRRKAAEFLEMLRVIREEEPPKPSTRLSKTQALPSIAANRNLEPKKLSGMLRGDLDWIVMKALEKDRARRYATANGLSRDLQRFLADEPVDASPPSTTHRVKRFVRRNKRTVVAATAVVAASIAGLIGTSLGLLQAQRQRLETATARTDADRAAQQTQRQLAAATLQRALALCEQGDIARGALWLGRGLELAHRAGADDVEQDCRWNLAAWTGQLHQLQLILPHPDMVLAVALSPDSQIVASGCKDGMLRLWKSATGELLAGPLDHKSAVKALAFHPHEPLILAGCDNGIVTLWDLQTRTRRGPVLRHDGPVSSVAFSPDGESILTGSIYGTANLLNTATGEMIGRPLDHDSARCPSWTKGVIAAFSPDGRSIVTAGGNNWTVKSWDARTTESKRHSFDAGSVVFSIAWRPSSNSILLGLMQNRTGTQRDAESGRFTGLPLRHTGYVESVAYSADGRTIVTGAGDHGVRLWDTATGAPLGAPMLHQDVVESVAASADGTTIVSGSADMTVRIWTRAQGNLIGAIRSGNWTRAAAFSPDGRAVLLGVFNDGAKIWNVANGGIEQVFESTAPNDEVEGVAFSPDGKTVFTQHSALQVVKWWDRSTGKLLGSIPPQGDRIQQMALSPDGTTIFTRTESSFRLWNAATGQPIGFPLHYRDRILGQAFHPDGKTIIVSSADGTTRVWSAVSGNPLGPATSHSNEISALAYSPNGRTILAAEGIISAQLFDASNWQPLRAPLEHRGQVRCVGFSPDGRLILTGGSDGAGRLWNAATCRSVGPALQHKDVVNVITCSPDGKTVMTASDDGTVKLWTTPEPLNGNIEEVASRVKSWSGMQLDANEVVNALDFETWSGVQRNLSGKPDAIATKSDHAPVTSFNDPAFKKWRIDTATLPADKQLEAVVKKLQELNPGFDGTVTAAEGSGRPTIENGAVTSLGFFSNVVTDISPVRALAELKKLKCGGRDSVKGVLSDLSPLNGMRLTSVDCSWSQVSDLSPLKGMPLTDLHCCGTSVSDLSAIRGMQLVLLNCGLTKVFDLSPLKGMPLTFLNCGTTPISDLSPLTGMKLTKLYCDKTSVSDLSPLAGMSLSELHFNDTNVSDASPLKGMPLTDVSCANTKVTDLSALKGMRLTTFYCNNTNTSDMLPLRGMSLKRLYCDNTRISDLSPLSGMKLNEVSFTPTQIRVGLKVLRQMPSIQALRPNWWDAAVSPEQFWKKYDAGEFGKPKPRIELAMNDPDFQQWMKEVAALPAEKQVETVAKKLRELNLDFDGTVAAAEGKGSPKIENGVVTGFGFFTEDVTDISPVRALAGLKKLRCWGRAAAKGAVSDLSPLKGIRLTTVDCSWTQVSDLSPLRGMPLTDLHCCGTSVSDLSAIREMQLAILNCGSSEVSDLSPLKGMPLTFLNCGTTRVSDLTPLAGMKLTRLFCDNTTISDLLPLEGMSLTEICFTPKNITKGIDIIRQMKGLNTINIGWGDHQSFRPDVFWAMYDAGEFGR